MDPTHGVNSFVGPIFIWKHFLRATAVVRVNLQLWYQLWQNRLNYSGSSALVIAIQPILTHRTSNGTTHRSVGSPPDATTVQQDRAGLPGTKASLQLYNSSPTFNLQHIKHYYKPLQLKINLYKHCLKWQAKQIVQVYSGRKLTRDYTRRRGEHHTQPEVWSHSGGSLPAGDGSHSTDQPNGTEVGHAGLSVGFSKVIPEKGASKTEYTNTQQNLPGIGYT
jgi:hypothetical protein